MFLMVGVASYERKIRILRDNCYLKSMNNNNYNIYNSNNKTFLNLEFMEFFTLLFDG